MQVEKIIDSRKSCRAFLSIRQVDRHLLRSIIITASRAPSNGNLQPWQIFVLTGSSLAKLKRKTKLKIDDQVPMYPEYLVYPKPLKDVYERRRRKIGEDLYQIWV